MDYKKEFLSILNRLSYSRGFERVFFDFLVMASAAVYNSFAKDPKIEEEYRRRASTYSDEENRELSHCLSYVTAAQEDKYQDFLGMAFMESELGNSRSGQFFTPYSISKTMAGLSLPTEWTEKRMLRILEPACGSGGMAIACCDVLRERKINFQRDVYIELVDVDERCARMAYLQMSLIGAQAKVVHGNSISGERWAQWVTPMFVMNNAAYHLQQDEMESPPVPVVVNKQYKMFEGDGRHD